MPANPYRVLYFNPSLPVVKFSKMVAKYHNSRELDMLKKCARLSGFRVVPSDKLNWKQRQKFQDNAFRVGRFVYYYLSDETAAKLRNLKEEDYEGEKTDGHGC